MIITINTDASFSYAHQKGSFAFWIVCNEFKILKSGVLRKKVKRAEVAEFRCIINALHTLFKRDCSKAKKIIINTDCLNVIHLIKNDKDAISKYRLRTWGEPLVNTYKQLRRDSRYKNLEIEFRHVRAHTGISDARSYVNEWCDTNAKAALQEEINREPYTYLLGDNGGVSNDEMKKLMPIGITFQHEYGLYQVMNYLNDNGDEVTKRNEVKQVYCERIYQ